jgi:hypothetical protein
MAPSTRMNYTGKFEFNFRGNTRRCYYYNLVEYPIKMETMYVKLSFHLRIRI